MHMTNATVEIVTANKQLIDELLAKNTHNRNAKKSHVEYLRRQIREGKWVVTNQGIGVSASGWIVDGGHRLEAIAAENYPPVQFVLVRGLPDSAQKYVDAHSRRSMTDVLTLFFDQALSTQTVACLNVISKALRNFNDNRRHSPDELIALFEDYGRDIKLMLGVTNAARVCSPVFGAMVFVLHSTGDKRVLEFCEQVIKGELLQTGDPALTLRNWLNSNVNQGGHTGQKERFYKTLSAVEAFLEGRRLTKLYARDASIGKPTADMLHMRLAKNRQLMSEVVNDEELSRLLEEQVSLRRELQRIECGKN